MTSPAAGCGAPTFEMRFGRRATFGARASGRVNLIGEHTDYNGGFVLPMAIPQHACVELALREDRTVRAFSADVGRGGEQQEYRLGEEAAGRGWLDYLQGVTWLLAAEGLRPAGFDVHISSSVPLGSGLSSSAALLVSLLRGLREALALPLDDVRLALWAQRVECDFVGAPVGVMDPMAASLAGAGAALFLDTRSLRHEAVLLPPGVEVAVINSGVAHRHAGGDYRLRRAECERAAALLGVGQLRDLPESELPRALALDEPLGRRVRHVVTENARVLQTVEALRQGNLPWLGALWRASHASQRDDYEVSIPEIDLLVELACAEAEVLGARLTGGGFGGSVVVLSRAGAAAKVAAHVAGEYARRTGHTPAILLPLEA